MSECTDKRYRDMLHAWELGLLSGDERRDLELHLMDCPACRKEARELVDAMRAVRSDSDVAETVRILSEREERATAREAAPRRRRFWATVIPTSVAAIIVLFALVLKDWQFDIHPTDQAIAFENRLAVMPFENLTAAPDSLRMGEVVANLITTDLSESDYVRVVSNQRLYDIMNQLADVDAGAPTREVAARVVREAGAAWMLLGSIVQVEPEMVVTSQLVDVSAGVVVASQRLEGRVGESVFALVDRLTVEVKADLSLPSEAMVEGDPSVADVTTDSPEAYRYYLQGLEALNKFYHRDAVAAFERALAYDSTFAMVYYRLSSLVNRDYIDRAVAYSDHVSKKEAFYIAGRKRFTQGDFAGAIAEYENALALDPDDKESLYVLARSHHSLGYYREAADYFERVVEVAPAHKVAYNALAYLYQRLGDEEASLHAIDQYIALAPGEANPYDSKGELLAAAGQIEPAIESYRRALAIRPDFVSSLNHLGRLYMFKGDYRRADSCFHTLALATHPHDRANGRYQRVLATMYRGQLDLAMRTLDEGIAADQAEDPPLVSIGKRLLKARILLESGVTDAAVDAMEAVIALNDSISPANVTGYRCFLARYLAANGDSLRAREVAEYILLAEDPNNPDSVPYLWSTMGIAFAEGDFVAAAAAYERIPEDQAEPYLTSMAGRAYLEMGRYEEAAAEFESLHSSYSAARFSEGVQSVRCHYYRGLAYERMELSERAIEQYRTLLDIWSEADSCLVEKDLASERLRLLLQSP